MKVRVSKKFASALNKAIKGRKENYCIDNIEVVEVNPRMFTDLFIYQCEECGDVDFDNNGNNVLKLLKVNYKDNDFALPKYFNTHELNVIAKRVVKEMHGKITIDTFADDFLLNANI